MDELTKIALVGTARYTGPVPGSEHPAAALVAGSDTAERERVLLLRCGAQSIYGLAGRCAVAGIDPMAPAPPETKNVASRKLAALLQGAAASDEGNLLVDFLDQMAARGIVLPPDGLPLLLPSKNKEVRERLIPVLGERGAWLCRQNPDWSDLHAGGPDLSQAPDEGTIDRLKQTWDEGTIELRCQALATLRRRDPATARDWVMQVLAREKAGDRVRLVECLVTGLCDGDEPFLDACLNDRSRAVGHATARLLCSLPRSALAGRMRERAEAMLELQRKGLILKSVKLVCTPPQQIDRAWERDGVPEQAPHGLGQRAFWTETVLAAMPPSHWQTRFGLEPQALIAAVTDDPFAGSVLSGWTQAAARFAAIDTTSAEWLAPLWQYWSGAVKSLDGRDREGGILQMQALLPLMPPDLAEARIATLLESARGWDETEALGFLDVLRRPWSFQFSAAFLATARRQVQTKTDQPAYQWALAANALACAIPAEAFPLALAPWEIAQHEETATWFAAGIRTALDKFVAAIERRQCFMTELDA